MSDEKFSSWAIVSLFGHKRLAGKISDFELGGESFIRVDVPTVGEIKEHTRLFGKGAIYSIDLVGQEIAEAVARQLKVVPVSPYDFDQETKERMRALPAPVNSVNQGFDGDDDDGDFEQDEDY